ncbi:hypothetical protein IKE71_02330 [Candidatus Saccharibacteria bacterium]|nr:hypothetical protein [Candidatus Saccharibacteria bacterium]
MEEKLRNLSKNLEINTNNNPPVDEPESNVPEPEVKESSEVSFNESPTRAKKYSPEVEAALSRLNSEDINVDSNAEPLSTEPKKTSHAGRVVLIVLFALALAAVVLCVLVERGIIENPLNLFAKKSASSAIVLPSYEETPLTDEELIAEIDKLFTTVYDGEEGNYYIFSRTHKKTDDHEFIQYSVAVPSAPIVLNGALDSSAQSSVTTAQTVTAENFEDFPHFLYVFEKTEAGYYEFLEKTPIDDAEVKEKRLNNLEK